MSCKQFLAQVLDLFKAHMASKRGQKKIAGVANMFSGMLNQLDEGRTELESEGTKLTFAIDDLQDQLAENEDQLIVANRLYNNIKEIVG